MSSSVTGRNACLSEKVTFTCTARGYGLYWWIEGVGELRVHHTSYPQLAGDIRAAVKSYDFNRNCLVSSLSLRATASRNRTRVMCTSRLDRSLSESLPLHIMSTLLFFVRATNCSYSFYTNNNIVDLLFLACLSSCSFCLQECESCNPIRKQQSKIAQN